MKVKGHDTRRLSQSLGRICSVHATGNESRTDVVSVHDTFSRPRGSGCNSVQATDAMEHPPDHCD